jgi:hypothetical protein
MKSDYLVLGLAGLAGWMIWRSVGASSAAPGGKAPPNVVQGAPATKNWLENMRTIMPIKPGTSWEAATQKAAELYGTKQGSQQNAMLAAQDSWFY